VRIPIGDLLRVAAPLRDFKLHLACWNGSDNPLDVFVRSRAEWDGWNSWRGPRDDFSRPYILSFMEFYPEPDAWLFGGIYRVHARAAERYEISVEPDGRNLIGRLKVKLKRPGRAKAFYLEKYWEQLTVLEVLRECYSGEAFCGYENINHDFPVLEQIFRTARPDWKAALQSVKGVYLITDKSNGMRYVGSAYGDAGIWSRWECYIGTGHGWNDELTKLINARGLEYARRNFRFALLEYRGMRCDDRTIIEREGFWKDALLTRGAFGYNRN
jgi:hypothetical protein